MSGDQQAQYGEGIPSLSHVVTPCTAHRGIRLFMDIVANFAIFYIVMLGTFAKLEKGGNVYYLAICSLIYVINCRFWVI